MYPATSFEHILLMLGTSMSGCLRPCDSGVGYIVRRESRIHSAESIGPQSGNSTAFARGPRSCPIGVSTGTA